MLSDHTKLATRDAVPAGLLEHAKHGQPTLRSSKVKAQPEYSIGKFSMGRPWAVIHVDIEHHHSTIQVTFLRHSRDSESAAALRASGQGRKSGTF
jgi:hypothetical protein